MATELPLVLDVLSDDLEIVFSFGEGDNFFFQAAAASTFRQENQQSVFSHDVAQTEARWNVKEKHKYRPQNVIRFHLQGCSYVLKRPPTLPTSKDTHSNDKRFGNLPPSFRSLAFFLRSITVKSLFLYCFG